MVRRRTQIEIIYSILKCLAERKHIVLITQLMYKVNLSHKLLIDYLQPLLKQELIVMENKKQIKRITHSLYLTDKGYSYLGEVKTAIIKQEKLLNQINDTNNIM